MIRTLLASFAALFALQRPRETPTQRQWLLLLAIVALGVVLRFWGLGAVGLHGDEETMAMPTQHIVEHGTSRMPSGMFYGRALGQLYLMAASVATFGESEWALRLPSALCGVLLIVIAFFVGRRFLTPAWNLGFVAAIALLPEFIVDAQTARMYVFFVTSVAAFLLFLFRWERTDRVTDLLGAVLMLFIGLQFHSLMVFSAPLLLYPGLVRGDPRKLVAGMIAFAIALVGFAGIHTWVEGHYPPPEEIEGFEAPPGGPRAAWAIPAMPAWLPVLGLAVAAGLAAFVVRALPRPAAFIAGALLAIGLTAQMLFAYHIAALFLAAGLIVGQRAEGRLAPRRVAVLLAVCAALALAHVVLLNAQGVGSLRQILGAMVGRPSVWPYLVTSGYSVAAAALIAAAVARALWWMANRRPIPDHLLFVALGLWAPLFLMGLVAWDIPLRYAAGQSFPFFLAAFAAAQWLSGIRWRAPQALRSPRAAAIAAAIVCLAIVNPLTLARTVNAGYAIHPDHKGAAQYIRSLELGPRDIIVAEDVLQQYYYLGHVDYWLAPRYVAAKFVRHIDGRPREIYLHAPVIGSGAELDALLEDPNRGTVYVIGSGEEQHDGRRFFRGLGIQETLDSPRFEVVYRGRDNLTQVWKAPPPSLAARK